MKTFLKKANQAYIEKNYRVAEGLYYKVVENTPELEGALKLNLELSRKRISEEGHSRSIANKQKNNKYSFGVVTTPHTKFHASVIANRLSNHGFDVQVFDGMPEKFEEDYYFVLTPNIFERLPPGEKRILYQLEQSVSSRWFTEKYFSDLENSLAVLDYSISNIKYLKKNGIIYPLVYFLPIGSTDKLFEKLNGVPKDIDVLFYGDSLSCKRRQTMLSELSKYFNVKIVNDVFGDQMQELIKRSKVVINIHYYEGALLETPRIMECLSLGTQVVSEYGSDMQFHTGYEKAVRFFEIGAVNEMIEKIGEALEDPTSFSTIESVVNKKSREFEYMFDRVLIGLNLLPKESIFDIDIDIPDDAKFICLSMPETFERSQRFKDYSLENCYIFNGYRRNPGWIGCGLSYQALAVNALRNNKNRISIMEDDVVLPKNFEVMNDKINRYLDTLNDDWSIFSGLIAHLSENTKILKVDNFEGVRFITIDKMTSTVFNIYNQSYLKDLVLWNPNFDNSKFNTIDRFIESHENLKVVTTLPFLVGHHEEVFSSLWHFQNTEYNKMIEESQILLKTLVDEFERGSFQVSEI